MKKLSNLASSAILAVAVATGVAFMAFADGLPEGYTQVPYIQANGNCQVLTGLVPNGTDKVEMVFRPAVVNATQTLWCSRTNTTERQFTAFVLNTSNGKMRFDRNDGGDGVGQVTSTTSLLACTNYLIVADYGAGTAVVTNIAANTEAVNVTMAGEGEYTPNSELGLFSCHNGATTAGLGNYASYALYSFKLKDSGGNLRLDLVPAKRDADDELGLYDLVRSVFLTNCLGGVFTTVNTPTITPSDPLWGKALTIADNITIDAGEGATWPGAIAVRDGGSLTTHGNLNVAGVTTIDANGSVTIEDGTSCFAFSANAIKGNLTVAAPATLKMNLTEAFQGAATTVFHLYGTLDAQVFRQRIDVGKFFFHDGSRVIGAGDGYGALYAYRNSRIVFDGNVEIEPPVGIVNAYTLTAACCENAHVAFKGGFKANTSSQKTGLFVQEAATADEGNAAGTCANAFIDIGPCSYAGLYYFTGSITLLSNARIALGNSVTEYTVTTSGTELEIVSDKATALANHATVQPVPAITTTTATVRLTGDGTVSLPTTAPSYPIEFAGPSLIIANNAPVALAAGSSVSAPTTVGVDGLAASTAATLFTNAGSIDVSKISAKTAHNGVPFGDAAAASLSGTDVVTAGVPAYVSYGWVEPYIAANALIWLDASDAANFEFKDNTFGFVTTWKDRSAYKRDATAYTIPSHDPNWGTLSVTNGVPAYCMGACDSGIDLQYTRMTTIRTVFWAMSICQSQAAFFLGDTAYQFHRGNNGTYFYNNKNAIWKNGKVYCDGTQVADGINTLVPTDRHVYSAVTAANCNSTYLSADRPSTVGARNGGREISELIAFPTALSDSDRNAIEAYLAAKWMGANPTAAGTEGTYAVTGDLAVDDHVGGDKNLSFGDGASVTVDNPSSTGAMVATTGAVTIPSGYALPVAVDASNLAPGTYTVIQAGSGITDLSQFNATATVGDGASASFAVVDGKLTLTISIAASATSQTWRPASSADLGWNTTSANWLYDGGTTGGFIPYVPAFFDGAESTTGDITVSGEMTAGPITVTGANDYIFKGTGTIAGGDKVTFGGTGTITLDGVNFGGQDIMITNGQKVVLGLNAGPNSLGADSGSSGGKVTIAEGSQLNINYTGIVSGNADSRAEITQLKTFSIAGDGPDGRGALVNDALDGRAAHNSYNAMFRRIELADDATIGGVDRVDIRARSGTAATATPGLYGPGKKLTVKNENYFCVLSQPIDVQEIIIPSGGMFLPATLTESKINIPGGITVDGGLVDLYNTVFPASMPITVTSNGGTIKAEGGAVTVKGNVNVASGAALALTGSQNVTYSGAFNANGATITHSNSATTYFKCKSAGPLDISKSAGSVYLGSGFSNSVVNITQTGGNCGLYTEATAPIFDNLNINATGGTIYILPQSTSALIDVPGTVNLGNSAKNVYVYGPANNMGIKVKVTGKSAQFGPVCNTTNPGTVYLKSGTDVTVTDFACGNVVSKPAQGHMIVENGAKVTITSRFMAGYWAGVPDTVATHRIDIYGEVDATDKTAYLTLDAVRSETHLYDGGVFKLKTFTVTRLGTPYPYGTGVGAGDGRQWFVMEGGRLELGAGGFTVAAIPGCTKFDFQNGTIVNTGAWTSMPYTLPVYFGHEDVGGSVEFNLDANNVSWNSGLTGASDLTIKGSANFAGNRAAGGIVQGAMLGKVTVENTGANDLRNASAFSGGLTLADGVNAQVGKYADEHYPYAVAGNYRERLSTNEWSLAYVAGANIWPFLHKRYTSGKPYGNTWSCTTRCDFYVPAEKAGAWTFCGAYDDYMLLQIDGEIVFNQAYNKLAAHTVTLAEGWHKAIIATYDGSGNAGPPASSGWNDGKSLGFIIGTSTSTAGGDYTKFEPGASLGDGLTLDVRPAVNACVWSWMNAVPAASTWSTIENWTHIKCIDSVAKMHVHGMAPANDTEGLFSGKLNRFQGWFKVEDDKAGEWTFKMGYDDYHLLKIDGVQLIGRAASTETVTKKTTLTAGWHRWEVRVGDGGSGGWGPDIENKTKINNGNTISYIAPGDTEKQFNETNLKLAATLGDIAVLEPSGIYKELELGAGSTLTSSGTMAMPIFGTLKGTGTLAGSFAFAGTTNCWEVTGAVATSATLPAATFSAATPATFAGLKSIKVTFGAKPTRHFYYLTDAVDGLSDAPAATVVVEDANGTDYSANFTLTVKNGRLALSNSKFNRFIFIVR